MLVIFGANGRTGIEVVKEAIARGIEVRPVVRDDSDSAGLDKIVDLNSICYGDADHPASLPSVIEGASAVVSCINPRTAGPNGPNYSAKAAANILQAAVKAKVPKVIHLSVVGAYRWSPNPLSRASFHGDRALRMLKDLPWGMLRASCYIDELVEGHVLPVDGGRPHKLRRSSRYAPISRRDMGRVVLDAVEHLKASRTLYVGGPEVFSGEELIELIAPHVAINAEYRTSCGALPHGDMSVCTETTLVGLGWIPSDSVQMALSTLRCSNAGVGPDSSATNHAANADIPGVYPKCDPGPHYADLNATHYKTMAGWTTGLRWAVHNSLADDLTRLGIDNNGVKFDFKHARVRNSHRAAKAHGGIIQQIGGIRVQKNGIEVYRGAIDFIRDELSDELRVWWTTSSGTSKTGGSKNHTVIPREVWLSLDMGVQRRLIKNSHFELDQTVHSFSSGHSKHTI